MRVSSQHVLYTVTGGAVILVWNLDEQAKGDEPKAVAAEVFGRHKKRARHRIDSDPALCVDALLFSLSQQAQTDGDKR